jgi:hypothetical protein
MKTAIFNEMSFSHDIREWDIIDSRMGIFRVFFLRILAILSSNLPSGYALLKLFNLNKYRIVDVLSEWLLCMN